MSGIDLFIADLHLSEETPGTTRAFFAFVAGPARTAERLFILGDLFEYWAGDDDLATPFNARVAEALRELSEGGTAIGFLPGNRDFLVGSDFAEASGLQRMDEPVAVDLAGRRALLMHGDTLCTDDEAYQTFRAQVRDPAWQAAFLARPLAERKAIIAQVREHSEATKQAKAADIMDVNPGEVDATFRKHDCRLLIHGHTHRPATHRLTVDGQACERWVLPDWHGNAPGIVARDGTLAFVDFSEAG